MGDLYTHLRQVDPRRKALVQQQAAWIKSRDRDCPEERRTKLPSYTCVSKRLEARVAQLQSRLQALNADDIEGPDEDDTGPGVIAQTPPPPLQKPKAKPRIAAAPPLVQPNVEVMPAPPIAAVPESVVEAPIPSPVIAAAAPSIVPAAEEPRIAEKPLASPSMQEQEEGGDIVDKKIKDAYRIYMLLRSCGEANVPGADPEDARAALRDMDVAAKGAGKDTDKLWESARNSKSENGDVNTMTVFGGILMPTYAFSSPKDQANTQQVCSMLVPMVIGLADEVKEAISPTAASDKPDLSAKDF